MPSIFRRFLALSLIFHVSTVIQGFNFNNNNQFFPIQNNDCCMLSSLPSSTSSPNLNNNNNNNFFPQPEAIRIDDGVILIRNSRDVFSPPPQNFYRSGFNSNSYIAGNNNFGVEQPQTYNYGQYNQQQQQSQTQNINPFQSTINNNFDANSWTQANANLFQQQQLQQQQQQQQSAFLQQQSSYPTQIQPQQPQQQVYGPGSGETNYGPTVQALTGYGGHPPSATGYQPQQQQNIQTYYPFNSVDNTYPQPAPTPVSTPQANIYSIQDQGQQQQQQQQQQQTYVAPQQPQQPEQQPVIYQPQPQQVVAPQQQQNYNSYPQFPEPEPEASSQPTIDNTNLQQYAQYLDILQKQYGIKLPAAGSSAVPTNIHEQQALQNPYAAAVQPQTQTHIQSQIQPGIYPQQSGEHSWNPWQQTAQTNNNNFNFQQQMNKPVVTTYVPSQPSVAQPQPQIQIQQPQQQQVYGNEVYQQPQPQQQPYYPGTSAEYASTNTVVEQPQQPKLPPPAPHIIFPSPAPSPVPQPRPQQPQPQPQTHVVVQPEVVTYTRPQPPQPKPQSTVYIQPTYPPLPQPSTTRPPPPPPQPQTRPSLEYEREVVVQVATTQPPTVPPPPSPRQPSPPSTPSTTSIQALTQQIRRLPAVLYVDSRNPETKRTESLLRETYGLPLVSFYVDKIDKPKAVERHLHQLTAHKGLPYLFICGTFIGSQQHIDNYHANRQVPQLVEFVCSDEKKRKHKKKTSAAAAATSAVVV